MTARKPSMAQRIADLEGRDGFLDEMLSRVEDVEQKNLGLHGELAEAQTDLYVVESNLRLVAAVLMLLLLVVFVVGTAWITKHV